MNQITLLMPLLILLHAGQASAVDLKITDSRGTEVVVTGAAIDYGGFVASDTESQGIRVHQGDGTVTVKWADIDSMRVTGEDASVKPALLKLEIVLRNGKKVPAALVRRGRMKLLGRTELGDYSIDLDKVRTITPVR